MADYPSTNINSDDDDLLASLSEAATASPITVEANTTKRNTKRKSKFFFTIKSDFDRSVEDRIEQFKPKVLEHIDAELVKRSDDYLKELPPNLESNIANIREFFLRELSPLTLAMSPGSTQALDVVSRALGIQVDNGIIVQFERMFAKGINIKMSKYVASYLGLTAEDADILLQSISPIRKEAVFIGADPSLNGYKKPEPA